MLKVGLWIFLLCLVVFRSSCYATSCKMKCSVGDSNLTGGEGLTKVRKFLDFGREDLGHAWRHWYRERFWSWKRRPTKCQIWEMFCVENSRRIKTSSGIKPKQSEDLYQLESWRTRNFLPVFVSPGILHLTSKPCPLKDCEPATQFPDHMLVVRSLLQINKTTITNQDSSLSHPR